MQKSDFGFTATGEKVTLYTLTNQQGVTLSVIDYGATWVELSLPDKSGTRKDVVLGYDTVAEYEADKNFLGAIIGRNANRIGGANFKLGERLYKLTDNDNGNNLHSGMDYFSKRMWQVVTTSESSITFMINSPHLDQGFPGNVDIEVSYTLGEEGSVDIEYKGTTDSDTILNMTNHSYFNLNGHNDSDGLEQCIWIDADYYVETDDRFIPTGKLIDVTGTPMDFRLPKKVGLAIKSDYETLQIGRGYNNNFVLNRSHDYQKVAAMRGEKSGICMEVYTDLTGVQLYSGGFLETIKGKGGHTYRPSQAICFETQYFPDAINHENFQSPICRKDQTYQTKTSYKFFCA